MNSGKTINGLPVAEFFEKLKNSVSGDSYKEKEKGTKTFSYLPKKVIEAAFKSLAGRNIAYKTVFPPRFEVVGSDSVCLCTQRVELYYDDGELCMVADGNGAANVTYNKQGKADLDNCVSIATGFAYRDAYMQIAGLTHRKEGGSGNGDRKVYTVTLDRGLTSTKSMYKTHGVVGGKACDIILWNQDADELCQKYSCPITKVTTAFFMEGATVKVVARAETFQGVPRLVVKDLRR